MRSGCGVEDGVRGEEREEWRRGEEWVKEG
jgi:hypothetical protein